MRTLRRLRAEAPRHARRRIADATIEQQHEHDAEAAAAGASPEAVFDRLTGPYGPRTSGPPWIDP